ncbi:MAG: PIN domain-containing protein [Actinomycetota bacterium]|nr:PIN domain-containing protein [Actinomycetota bacterium]
MELADTSAWTSGRQVADVAAAFDELVARGEIATCAMVKAELLFERRTARDVTETRRRLDLLLDAPIGERAWRRALDVLELLAERGPLHHRAVPIQDLLVAAAAERAEIPVLHYDRHFEVIASVTGQPVRALAPLGSL